MKKTYLLLIAVFFALQLTAQTNDVGIVNIIEPGFHMCANRYYEVKVRIKNFGTQTQTSFPVSYQRGCNPTVTETFNGLLLAGDSADFTFMTKVVCPIGTSFSLCYWTKLSNDMNLQNDTICYAYMIVPYYVPQVMESQTNYIINAFTNSTVSYHTCSLYQFLSYYNISIYWNYIPANDVTILTNAAGDSATIHFGNNASSGILTVYALTNYCNSDTLHYTVNLSTLSINNIENNSFLLSQNTPNPASANTIIEYSLPSAGNISFEVLDILGQTVYSKTEKQQAGKNCINLNVKDFKNGIYFYSIEFKGKKQFKKMMVAR